MIKQQQGERRERALSWSERKLSNPVSCSMQEYRLEPLHRQLAYLSLKASSPRKETIFLTVDFKKLFVRICLLETEIH